METIRNTAAADSAWIPWQGAEPSRWEGSGPVLISGTRVYVRYRDGSQTALPKPAEALTWTATGGPEGIISFRPACAPSSAADEALRFSKVAGQQSSYSPAEQRAFNAGRAFAERVACAEQNARSRAVTKIALDGLGDDFGPWEALQEIVKTLYPDLADLADQDPALARRALDALQPY